MKIGVFDSGVGGKSFIDALQQAFPDAEIIYKDDKQHLPYGDKTKEQLIGFTIPIFQAFESEGCSVVLIACNTVSTTILDDLQRVVTIPLVGVEPMVKEAVELSRTGNIAVCATPATLQSGRYAALKQGHASTVSINEPDCSDWAQMIQDNRSDELELTKLIVDLVAADVDVLVLACTHYHWIEQHLTELAKGHIRIIQPIDQSIDHLRSVLQR